LSVASRAISESSTAKDSQGEQGYAEQVINYRSVTLFTWNNISSLEVDLMGVDLIWEIIL